MALDPSIALNPNRPPPVDMFAGMERGMNLAALGMKPAAIQQSIEASKAAQKLTEAQTPGAIEQSAQQVIKTSQDRGRVKAAQEAVELGQDGKPIVDPVTGTLKINRAKFLHGLYTAGLGGEALLAEAGQFKATQEQQKVTGTAIDMNNSVRNHLAVAAKAAYDNTPGTEAQKTAAASQVWEQLADLAIQGSEKTGLALDKNQLKYSPGMEQVLYKAQITPGTQITLDQGQQHIGIAHNQLKLATAQFDNSRLTNFTDDASKDSKSAASQRARDIVRNSTGEVLPDNMTATEIYNQPKYKELLKAVGANSAAHITQARQVVNMHDSVRKSIIGARSDLAKSGLRPIQLVEHLIAGKLADNPKLRALAAQLQQLPKGVVSSADSFEALLSVNDAMGDQAKANIPIAAGNAPGSPVIGSGKSPAVTAGQQVIPAAEPAKPAGQLKAGDIHNGLPVLSPAAADNYPKGQYFYGTNGEKYKNE